MGKMVLAAALLLVGCGGSGTETPAPNGPRLEAERAATWPSEGPGRQAAFSRDGALLATTSATGRVTVRRTTDWRITSRFTPPDGTTSAAFAADGKRLYTAGYDGIVRGWDLASGRQAQALTGAAGTVWSLDVAPDGKSLAAAGEDKMVRIWPLDGGPARILRGHERNVWEVRFSPDGARLASGSFDMQVRIWNVASGVGERVLSAHDQAVVGLAFSADGKLLATSGDDSVIHLWRTADFTRLRTIDAGNHAYKVAFSPDGRWLASGGRARSAVGTLWHQISGAGAPARPVSLWRVADGALIAALPQPDDVSSVVFSPNGRNLVTAGEDGAVRLWRLRVVGERSR
ncbi:MAG TPA: WD40 repeat domain-containing protein [Allosphingosinicella sp.]|jgi:WD40 repeat protein